MHSLEKIHWQNCKKFETLKLVAHSVKHLYKHVGGTASTCQFPHHSQEKHLVMDSRSKSTTLIERKWEIEQGRISNKRDQYLALTERWIWERDDNFGKDLFKALCFRERLARFNCSHEDRCLHSCAGLRSRSCYLNSTAHPLPVGILEIGIENCKCNHQFSQICVFLYLL